MVPEPGPGSPAKKAPSDTSRLASLLAIVAGVVCVFAGLGLGVSVVLLPVGIPLGIFGLLLVFAGLFARSRKP